MSKIKLNKQPQKVLDPLSKKWAAKKEFLEELGPAFVDEVKRRIERTKSDPEGRRWKPWALSTARARRAEGTASSGLLLRRGKLRDSIVYEIQGPKLVIRSTAPYAQYLQAGTRRMPARPFLGTGKRERELMTTIWKKWIKL